MSSVAGELPLLYSYSRATYTPFLFIISISSPSSTPPLSSSPSSATECLKHLFVSSPKPRSHNERHIYPKTYATRLVSSKLVPGTAF